MGKMLTTPLYPSILDTSVQPLVPPMLAATGESHNFVILCTDDIKTLHCTSMRVNLQVHVHVYVCL